MEIEQLIHYDFHTITPFSSRDSVKNEILKYSALVVKDDEQYYGVLTKDDLVKKPYTLIVDCLSETPKINSNCDVYEALETMNDKRTEVLTVYDDTDTFLGLLFKNDILKYLNAHNLELEKQIIKKTEQLQELNDNLELIIKQKTEILKTANKDKDKFLQILAHDLKTPFNSLLGFSNLLIKNYDKFDKNKIEDILMIMNNTSKNTYELFEQILLWTKSQSGQLTVKLESFEFNNQLRGLLNCFNNQAKGKNITISFCETEQLYLFADLNMFNTIMRNLISNAIKFTNYDGKINIYCTKNSKYEALITISDNGMGIKNSVIEKLWNISENYSTIGTNNEKGTGFGLKLCKELVEKQGGSIWVESIIGKGSNFKFTLPLYIEK